MDGNSQVPRERFFLDGVMVVYWFLLNEFIQLILIDADDAVDHFAHVAHRFDVASDVMLRRTSVARPAFMQAHASASAASASASSSSSATPPPHLWRISGQFLNFNIHFSNQHLTQTNSICNQLERDNNAVNEETLGDTVRAGGRAATEGKLWRPLRYQKETSYQLPVGSSTSFCVGGLSPRVGLEKSVLSLTSGHSFSCSCIHHFPLRLCFLNNSCCSYSDTADLLSLHIDVLDGDPLANTISVTICFQHQLTKTHKGFIHLWTL